MREEFWFQWQWRAQYRRAFLHQIAAQLSLPWLLSAKAQRDRRTSNTQARAVPWRETPVVSVPASTFSRAVRPPKRQHACEMCGQARGGCARGVSTVQYRHRPSRTLTENPHFWKPGQNIDERGFARSVRADQIPKLHQGSGANPTPSIARKPWKFYNGTRNNQVLDVGSFICGRQKRTPGNSLGTKAMAISSASAARAPP